MADLTYDRAYQYNYTPDVLVWRVVNTIFGIVTFLIVLRIVLQLFAASSSSPFVAWVYSVTDILIAPFAGAFSNWNVAGFVLDMSALFALVGYAIIGWLVARLLSLLTKSLP